MRLGRVGRFQAFYEGESGAGSGAGASDGGQAGGADGAEHWQAEAKKAFRDRDELKKKLRDLEGRALSDEDKQLFDSLKEKQAKADEERKRKEGEFDAWRADILKKHDGEVKSEREKRTAAEARLRQKLIGLEFASASALFGENGKTVLTPDVAEAYFSRYVDVQSDEAGDRVVVKGLDGHVILDAKTGKPMAFADALAEVIEGLPTKDRLLRGSGKTGSGSSGGAEGRSDKLIDASQLTPEQRRDPNVLARLRAQQPRGGSVAGRAYS